MNAIEPLTVIRALADVSREVRLNAVRIAERWLGEADHPVQRAVIALAADRDWAVRQQVAASLGALPAGLRERSLAAVLERHGLDPVMTDAALSGLRGLEPAVLAVLLSSDAERTPSREAAVTMVAATIVRSGQESAVADLFARIPDPDRPAWQRAAVLRGAEVAILGAAMPGTTPPVRPPARPRHRVRPVPAAGPVRVAPMRFHARPTGRPRPDDRMRRRCG